LHQNEIERSTINATRAHQTSEPSGILPKFLPPHGSVSDPRVQATTGYLGWAPDLGARRAAGAHGEEVGGVAEVASTGGGCGVRHKSHKGRGETWRGRGRGVAAGGEGITG
jgi:hypothetical protein